MKQISFLIKPASSLCNLNCSYCFYKDIAQLRDTYSYGIMNETTIQNIIQQALNQQVEQINFCFQGGEPTLAGIQYYQTFIHYVNLYNTQKKRITYAIQTNGTTLNKEWITLFKTYDFLVGVSLDGFLKNHDSVRKDQEQNGTFQKIIASIKTLEEENIKYNILTVLTNTLAKHPVKLYNFYKRNHFEYVQLIPCLPSLDTTTHDNTYALTPQDFASFYKTFFDLWYQDYLNNKKMSIILFDNVISMFKGELPYQCGMLGSCQLQFVIEANGDVYPCDFYVLDEYLCGNINQNTLQDIMNSKQSKKFLNQPKTYCALCANCMFKPMCNGNCKRQNICMFNEHYCGYQEFLTHAYQYMMIRPI